MIPAIVFSKDRACQLDALLHSFSVHAAHVFDPVYVLWTASDLVYADGYRICQQDHERALFVKEANFREDVVALLEGRDRVCFFTDDDVLYDAVDWLPEQVLHDNPYVLAFSLRLGQNTTYCYPLDRQQQRPFTVDHSTHLLWEWEDADGDFGYPLSLDGHVFRAADIRDLIDGEHFASPNHLEDLLSRKASELVDRLLLASYHSSRLVGVPVNIVNVSHPNRHAVSKLYPVWELNRRYLNGDRIQHLEAIHGAHQELELVLG